MSALAEGAPRYAALLVESSPTLLNGLAGMGAKGLDAIARVYSFLSPQLRERARAHARDLAIKLAGGCAGRRGFARGSKLEGAVDVDVEGTVERVLERGRVPEAIVTVYSRKRGRAYALIIDRSSSMAGFELVLGSLACSMPAYAGDAVDEFSVLAFNTEVRHLKGLRERREVEELVSEILLLEAQGYTDIYTALVAARGELVSAGYEPRAFLITDAEWTAGENPLRAVPPFRELNVICVPSKWLGLARALAELGRGELAFVRSIEDAYAKLKLLLSSRAPWRTQ